MNKILVYESLAQHNGCRHTKNKTRKHIALLVTKRASQNQSVSPMPHNVNAKALRFVAAYALLFLRSSKGSKSNDLSLKSMNCFSKKEHRLPKHKIRGVWDICVYRGLYGKITDRKKNLCKQLSHLKQSFPTSNVSQTCLLCRF